MTNLRTLSDKEVVTFAEGSVLMHDDLFRELLYRLARSCGHSLGYEGTEHKFLPSKEERIGSLP